MNTPRTNDAAPRSEDQASESPVVSLIRVCAVVVAALLPFAAISAFAFAATRADSSADHDDHQVVTPEVPGSATDATAPDGVDVEGPQPTEEWVRRIASATGVPPRALHAYAHADLVLRGTEPGCRLSWATLAAIGKVESDHGRFGGVDLDANGRPALPIIGPPLDGSPGVQTIVDTDDGALDGDTEYDHAVGPLQFIPTTWDDWGVDADADGNTDPQDIDDAALSAGQYLCTGDRDLTDGDDWWAAVLSYNDTIEYAQLVLDHANDYARRSVGGT